MNPEYFIVGGIAIFSVIFIWRKTGVRRVLHYARGEGWEPLIADSYNPLLSDDNRARYRLRYRDKNGDVHECVLESSMVLDFVVARTQPIPAKTFRAMNDSKIPMSCMRCGHNVPSGQEQCPYCHRWRHELIIT